MKIIISSGSYKFHLLPLSHGLAELKILKLMIVAGWPIGWQKKIAVFFIKSKGWKRFLDRFEPVPEKLVLSIPLTEVIFKIADIVVRRYSKNIEQHVHVFGMKWYAHVSSNKLKKTNADIYHYRNCYGGRSINLAKSGGMVTLCDHSIAHPVCLDWMENNLGSWPNYEKFSEIRKKMPPLYKRMESDLIKADHVVVNSDFVKETLIHLGYSEEKIHVVYLGVDDSFYNSLARSDSVKLDSKNEILFAGGWQTRKGVKTLMDSLKLVEKDWILNIVGGIESELIKNIQIKNFLENNKVKYHGVLPRSELANLMKKHNIFVFPSYCEGSARVIFEAMAAGCFIITTPNAGSIVQNFEHGLLVKPGCVKELTNAINYALENPSLVSEIGKKNETLIGKKYKQKNYISEMELLYKKLLNK